MVEPKLYAKYHEASARGPPDILYGSNAKVEKGVLNPQTRGNILKRRYSARKNFTLTNPCIEYPRQGMQGYIISHFFSTKVDPGRLVELPH